MATTIPVKNIYHMLCYAWDVLEQAETIEIDSADNDRPLELLTKVLLSGVNHLLKQGLGREYIETEEIVANLRGQIDFVYSERRFLTRQGRALCRFDELSNDFLSNQIIKASLQRLFHAKDLDKELRHQVGILLQKFHDIETIRLNRQVFKRMQLHRNNRVYRFLLNICELIYGECLLDESEGKYKFRDFYRDDGPMARVYEKFIFNFYKKMQFEYQVSSERIHWNASSENDPELALLPSMLTDVSLRSEQRTLIIDAKYYQKTLSTFHGKSRIHSANLYQINAYLDNLEVNGGNDARAQGMLLYPVIDQTVSACYEIGAKTIRIETLDLAQDWDGVERELMGLLF
ncbi:MAG: 5-methylcytosine-specific restriction endonuclease system specificity protein McrC [Pseudomonadales bacterium]|nr:5-methylcytosine-specific restriction endonuclease system specificity protein McrC [Pseudomonadales bacterium]